MAKKNTNRTETTTAAQQSQLKRTAAHTILERSVCLTLQCHFLGNNRKVDMESIDLQRGEEKLDTDKKQLHLTKKIVDNKLLNPAIRIIYLVKAYLRSKAISTHRIFGERTYLIPMAMVQEVDAKLVELQASLMAEAEKLSAAWTQAIEEQRVKLGPLFREQDYITPEQVKAAWGIEWSYVSFAAPDKLETVDHAIYESSVLKHEAKLADAYDEVRMVLRETLRQIVGDITKRLEPDADGKKKVFRNTLLDDLTEYLETFKKRNLTDDAELDRLVKTLKSATKGIDANALRDGDALRENLLNVAREATSQLDSLVEKSSSRSFSFKGVAAA